MRKLCFRYPPMSHIFRKAPAETGIYHMCDTQAPRSCKAFALSHYHRTVHVPDGFIDAPTSAVTGVVAAAAVAVSLRGARRELDERTAPLAGLVAAFIFAVQMLNFPVAAGTSGHLLGGALGPRSSSDPSPARCASPSSC